MERTSGVRLDFRIFAAKLLTWLVNHAYIIPLPCATLSFAGKARPMTDARAIAAAIVQTALHLRLTELAKLLGRDISAPGKAAQ